MAHIISITDFDTPELDVYARLTENQLVNRADPANALFIAESPLVIGRALESGCDGDEFSMMERLHRLTGTEVPRNLAGLQGRTVRHRDVIDKEQMLDYVLAEVMRS